MRDNGQRISTLQYSIQVDISSVDVPFSLLLSSLFSLLRVRFVLFYVVIPILILLPFFPFFVFCFFVFRSQRVLV